MGSLAYSRKMRFGMAVLLEDTKVGKPYAAFLAPRLLSFAAHQVMNPIIDVQGDKATGIWKLFQPCTQVTAGGPRAVWLAAIYNDDYVKVGGKWMFKHLKVNSLFFTPYEDGWVKKQFA